MDKRKFLMALAASPALPTMIAAIPSTARAGRRVSCLKDDSGYAPFHWRCKVTLDGVVPKLCVTADEALGEVVCYRADARGRLIIECGRIATEVRRGIVRIIDL